MGWKKLKEHYRITHIVQVTDAGICIGSGYIHGIIIIGMDGEIKKRYSSNGNPDLMRYQQEMDADRETLRRIISEPDVFEAHIPVYTYQGSEIIETMCEEPGWPNITHDGHIMYENTYSLDKSEVIRWAKREAIAAIKSVEQLVEDTENKLARLGKKRDERVRNLQTLNELYPAEA